MTRRPMLWIVVLAAALLAGGTGYTKDRATPGAGSDAAPDRIIISYPAGEDTIRQKYFNHKDHSGKYQVPCAECHHVFEDGKNVWQEGMPVQKCTECHDDPGPQGHENLGVGVLLKKMCSKIDPHPGCGRCHAAGSGD